MWMVRLAYMMPVGEGNFSSAVEALMEDAQTEGAASECWGYFVDMREQLEEAFPERFVFTSTVIMPIIFIYVLIWLVFVGKNISLSETILISSRLLILPMNIKPLTPELISECLRLEAQWCRANNCAENEALVAGGSL